MVRSALSLICGGVLVFALAGAARAQAVPPAPGAQGPRGGAPATTPAPTPAPEAQSEPEPAPPAVEPDFGATAQVNAPDGDSPPLEARVARSMPGALGDPFRMAETMPGAAPMVAGLPYVYVRGSPPSGNAYYYDGIPLPQLYHLGLGPGVLHPMLIGPIKFYPGASPARYGRRLGAVIDAEGPRLLPDAYGEVDLRLLDANAAIVTPVGDATIVAAGRYGYPGALTPLLGIDLTFSYWDYQLRAVYPLSSHDTAVLVALGSHDDLDNADVVGASVGYDEKGQDLALDFHRVEARLIRRLPGTEIGTALRVGYDHSHVGVDVSATSYTLSPRAWLHRKLPGGQRLRFGVDMLGASGSARQLPRDISFDDQASQAVARNTVGAYGEAELRPWQGTKLDLGLRTDTWIVGGRAEPTLDPRLTFTVYPTSWMSLHAGAAMVHQPVVFVFPLPALTDVAVDRGLQRALQSELGAGFDLNEDTRFETNVFMHGYSDLLLPEVYLRALGDDAQRADALTYGLEAFLHRKAGKRVSGWISYTLARAVVTDPITGDHFRPEFDIRHVVNLVAQVRVVGGLSAGVRVLARSGKPVNQFTDQGIPASHDLQLPFFVKLDARVGYRWETGFGSLDLYAEMLNATLAREAVDAECFFGSCKAVLAEPIFFPNLGLRAGF